MKYAPYPYFDNLLEWRRQVCFSTTRRLINTLLEGVMTDPQPIDMTEIWKPVVGWEPYYEVSSLGRVRSRDRLTAISDRMGRSYVRLQKGRILAEATGERGRKAVCLSLNSKHESWLVHRLVCIAFHGPAPSDQHEVAHRNGKPWINAADNLRWLTTRENNLEQDLHGTRVRGEASVNAKLTEALVRECRERALNGEHEVALAESYGVCRDTINKVITRRSWAHVA